MNKSDQNFSTYLDGRTCRKWSGTYRE